MGGSFDTYKQSCNVIDENCCVMEGHAMMCDVRAPDECVAAVC